MAVLPLRPRCTVKFQISVLEKSRTQGDRAQIAGSGVQRLDRFAIASTLHREISNLCFRKNSDAGRIEPRSLDPESSALTVLPLPPRCTVKFQTSVSEKKSDAGRIEPRSLDPECSALTVSPLRPRCTVKFQISVSEKKSDAGRSEPRSLDPESSALTVSPLRAQ